MIAGLAILAVLALAAGVGIWINEARRKAGLR